ncbi:alpha/beta hydrolase [Streptomyces sp. NPDC047971]|uniref:alpha/beta hydrolase n=1 Tax=Streptomyces sp. NPDC047971 TaxID=3154499 RepID=UPI0033F25EEF
MASRQRSRLRRTLLAALVTASVAVPTAGAARPAAVPAPAPAELGPLTRVTATDLDARYAANRDAVRAAERTAADYGDRKRAAALHAMAAPDRRFLSFDGRDGGRSVEVVGDLARAEHLAVLVPGSDTALGSERFRDGAVALQRRTGERAAVLGWLGYPTPATASAAAITSVRAEQAAPVLRDFVEELRAAKPTARITLLCHSYGSVVCAKAAPGLPVSGIVLYGSPGTGADSAADLRSTATVWAGRGRSDWIAHVPHLRVPLPSGELGFGTDPLAPEFGARVFDAGDGGHSDYLVPGSVPLKRLADIVVGQDPADA